MKNVILVVALTFGFSLVSLSASAGPRGRSSALKKDRWPALVRVFAVVSSMVPKRDAWCGSRPGLDICARRLTKMVNSQLEKWRAFATNSERPIVASIVKSMMDKREKTTLKSKMILDFDRQMLVSPCSSGVHHPRIHVRGFFVDRRWCNLDCCPGDTFRGCRQADNPWPDRAQTGLPLFR